MYIAVAGSSACARPFHTPYSHVTHTYEANNALNRTTGIIILLFATPLS